MESALSQAGLQGVHGGASGKKDLGATHGNGVFADHSIEPS